MSKYFTDDGYTDRRRLTNTRLLALAATGFARAVDYAFQEVQNDIEAVSGSGAGPLTFDFAASSVWVVNHNLGRDVSVEVMSSGGARIGAEVIAVSPNQVRVYFEVPVPGRVLVR